MTTLFITVYDELKRSTLFRLQEAGVPGAQYMETSVSDWHILNADDPIRYIKDCLSELARRWTKERSEMCRVARAYDGSWIITSMPLAAELDAYWSDPRARPLK